MSASAAAATSSLNFFEGPDVGIRFSEATSQPLDASGSRIAIYLRLSMLAENIRRGYHLDLAKHSFASTRGGMTGDLYLFDNSDMVLLSPNGDTETTENLTQGLTVEPGQGSGSICNWFDLATQADQFKEFCRPLNIGEGGTPCGISRPADPGDNVAPIDTEMLAKLERGLRTIDVGSFLRRQPICKILPGLHTNPKHVANEVYVHVADLREAILPDVDLTSNRWLFRHLTAQLDRRVLSTIQLDIQSFLRTPISLNMNLKNIMSEDFTQLVRMLSPAQREKIIIEIHCIDLLADAGAFMFVKSYLGHTGFKMALDGTDLFSFPEFSRHDMGFHYVKLQWNDALENGLPDSEFQKLQQAVARFGSEKVILCHCGTPSSKDIGHKLGVHNFQGRHIDEYFNPTTRRQN